MADKRLLEKLKGGLIVSCQALEDEPLHGADVMSKMAKAAMEGGAIGIRANGSADIKAIQETVDLPIIGLVKRDYTDSEVYITATKKEVDELLEVHVPIIAIDMTNRHRPDGGDLCELIEYVKTHDVLIMADISTFEEGVYAEKLGVDCISTTLSGYTSYSHQLVGPDFELIERLARYTKIPVFAEGKISTPEEASKALGLGAFAVVVGSAITRPQDITKKYVKGIQKEGKQNVTISNFNNESVERTN